MQKGAAIIDGSAYRSFCSKEVQTEESQFDTLPDFRGRNEGLSSGSTK